MTPADFQLLQFFVAVVLLLLGAGVWMHTVIFYVYNDHCGRLCLFLRVILGGVLVLTSIAMTPP